MMIDPICDTPSLDPTLFQQLTSPYFDINTFKPFLCEVMKLAGVDNIDPILYSPEPFDFASVVLNFASLTGVGDPRVSLGSVLSAGFAKFYPLAVAQVEVIRAGGCQIIDGYVCDSDGNKKKQAIEICPKNYSAAPINAKDIQTYAAEYIYTEVDSHAKRFSDYLKTLQADGWTITLHYYVNYYMFYVKAIKGDGVFYQKYYPDAQTNLSDYLNIPISFRTDSAFDNQDHFTAMTAVSIPEY